MSVHPIRKRLRLEAYDYTSPGAYVVTVCTHQRNCLFGEVLTGGMLLSEAGLATFRTWQELPQHFADIHVDAFVVMPNHVHGIVFLEASPVGAKHASPLPKGRNVHGTTPGSLGAIVQAFKSAASRQINSLRGTPGAPVWQRGYFEHIVRSPRELDRLRGYIESNPLRWELDRENRAGL